MQPESHVGSALFRPSLLLMTSVLIFGCQPTAVIHLEPSAHEGVTLKAACARGRARDCLTQLARPWTLIHGVTLDVVAIEPGDAVPADIDVALIEPSELGRWALAGLQTVPESLRSENHPLQWSGLFRFFKDRLLSWDRRVCALPILSEATVCVWSVADFQDAARQQAFEKQYHRALTPPATWQEFVEVAEFFTQQRQQPSLPPLPTRDEDLDRLFHAVAAPLVRRAVPEETYRQKPPTAEQAAHDFSFHYDLTTGLPRLTEPGFVEALTLYQRLHKCRPAEPARRPFETFRDGQAVLALVTLAELAELQRPNSRSYDRFGIRPVPGSQRVYDRVTAKWLMPMSGNRVDYLGVGGVIGVVPMNSKQSSAAWDLLAELASPSTGWQVLGDPSWGCGPYRDLHLDARARPAWSAYGLDAKRTNELLEALGPTVRPTIVNPLLKLRIPDASAHQAALMQSVRLAWQHQRSAVEALNLATARWQELDRTPSPRERLNWYRLSVGLADLPRK